uniref:Oxysterol-binding protein n=1 Tax=Esox lucius TaxID=8010 RepID=A0A6Q2YLR1_ESOLU
PCKVLGPIMMEPQVCPPSLNSSQSVMSGLDKSPSAGGYNVPGICEGFLLKKRKYPMKGWHKRYFFLEKGILKYSKTKQDIQRGRLHGTLDVSLAVMSINKKSKRIDLDGGEYLYHLKVYFCSIPFQFHISVPITPTYPPPRQPFLQYVSISSYPPPIPSHNHEKTLSVGRPVQRAPSAAESMSVYYDATDVIACENSSENEEDESDESGLSDVTNTTNSEPDEVQATITRNFRASVSNAPDRLSRVPTNTGRRTVLPAHCVDNSHIGIMSILYNNIGKDLSRVSMPCGLNEPLSLLQRVSEELEYSELLDIANHTEDPFERMLYVGVFSISGYAWATWRNRYKPFNPVLGETYESVREDRGFRYIAEQVSHHPPCSAVHAESKNFTFWQDQRWKNKFWGKSLEIISSGPVHVTLPKSGDHYEWNKAVTCIHNVLSQQRWLEHYGDITIRNNNSDICTCKITFVKSRYWGSDSSKNEVQGQVLNRAGEVVHRFGGLWHEGIFCDTLPIPQCLWKPSVQPEDHYQYYGFSRYARELNELTPELQKVLPPTDTRFRPDQRILEEGDVAGADRKKEEVEQKQRERRKELAKKGEEHMPRFFRNEVDAAGNEIWLSNDTYWKIRERPGFAKVENPDLWC